MIYGGIDGCKFGWILVKCIEGRYSYGGIYSTIENLFKDHNDMDRVLIDIPIGLSEPGHIRTLDAVLRKEMPLKASSVFNAPARQAASVLSYDEAKRINLLIEGKSLSKQTFNISNKIKEIDNFIIDNKLKKGIIESHPELCFMKLNDEYVLPKKSSKEGVEDRLAILNLYDRSLVFLYKKVLSETKRKDVKPDDILDALCLCLVNKLAGVNSLSFVEDQLRVDAKGIPMRVGFYKSYVDD